MALGLLVIGLWPLSFQPVNQVQWIDGEGGLRFQPNGLIYDPVPLDPPMADRTPGTVTVELQLTAENEPHDNLDHILTIDDGRLPSRFVLCQWKDLIILRVTAPNKRGYDETGLPGALKSTVPTQITLTCDSSGTTWYVDGVVAQHSPDFLIPSDPLHGRLIIGDSAHGRQSWQGRLRALTLFDRALDADEVQWRSLAWSHRHLTSLTNSPGLVSCLTFREGHGNTVQDESPYRHRLLIPEHYQPMRKSVLIWPPKWQWKDSLDIFINLIGFIPFGSLCFWSLRTALRQPRKNSVVFALIAGALVSLCIEITQIWLPNRYSSSVDLLCNTLGTAIGIFIAARLLTRK